MEVIHATWEKRNLGLDAYEILLTEEDCIDGIITLKNIQTFGNVGTITTIKLPAGQINMLHELENAGFRFMETQIQVKKNLRNYVAPSLIAKLNNTIEQVEIKKEEMAWEKASSMISEGMFSTDRIYLDPLFRKDVACKRYQNWFKDLLNDIDAHAYLYVNRNQNIGIGVVKYDSDRKIVHDILEGVFENNKNSGLGYLMFDVALRSYSHLGMKKLVTSISSNNLNILQLDLAFGYEIEGMNCVVRKVVK